MVVRPERLVRRGSGHRPRAAWVCRRLQAGAGAEAPPGKADRQEQEQKPGEGRPPASFDSGGSRVQGKERDRGIIVISRDFLLKTTIIMGIMSYS